jgi:hypothetical protein
LVAGDESDCRPVLVVHRVATAVVPAVRIHAQHFSAHVVVDTHALAAPGWKPRLAELYPDMAADVIGR